MFPLCWRRGYSKGRTRGPSEKESFVDGPGRGTLAGGVGSGVLNNRSFEVVYVLLIGGMAPFVFSILPPCGAMEEERQAMTACDATSMVTAML